MCFLKNKNNERGKPLILWYELEDKVKTTVTLLYYPKSHMCVYSPNLKDVIYFIFREQGRERERKGEKHQMVASHMPSTGDLVHNSVMCPDQEWNQRPFGWQTEDQFTELHNATIATSQSYSPNL